MGKIIYLEDIETDMVNKELYNKLINLVKEYEYIIICGLNSNHRHEIYKNIYYPLRFEKIKRKIDNKYSYTNITNTDIKVYNFKLKEKNDIKEENPQEKMEEEVKGPMIYADFLGEENEKEEENENEKEEENENEKEEEEEEEEEEKDEDFICDESDNESDNNESFDTEIDDQITKVEILVGETLGKMDKMMKKFSSLKFRINLSIGFNLVCWFLFYHLDPVRLIVDKKCTM